MRAQPSNTHLGVLSFSSSAIIFRQFKHLLSVVSLIKISLQGIEGMTDSWILDFRREVLPQLVQIFTAFFDSRCHIKGHGLAVFCKRKGIENISGMWIWSNIT